MELNKKYFGYKIANYDGRRVHSIFDKSVIYSLERDSIHTGRIYLGTSEKYAIDYYSTGSEHHEDPEDVLLTYEYSPEDIIHGNPEDKDYITGGTEIIVKKAKLIAAYNLTKHRDML